MSTSSRSVFSINVTSSGVSGTVDWVSIILKEPKEVIEWIQLLCRRQSVSLFFVNFLCCVRAVCQDSRSYPWPVFIETGVPSALLDLLLDVDFAKRKLHGVNPNHVRTVLWLVDEATS